MATKKPSFTNIHNLKLKHENEITPSLLPISNYDIVFLRWLYENSKSTVFAYGYDGYDEFIARDFNGWINDIIVEIRDNVSYICNNSEFSTSTLISREQPSEELYEVKKKLYKCDYLFFKTLDELKEFLCKNKFNNLVLYKVQKLVNLDKLIEVYKIGYCLIDDIQQTRANKIEHIVE
jgi:hypothetical protein